MANENYGKEAMQYALNEAQALMNDGLIQPGQVHFNFTTYHESGSGWVVKLNNYHTERGLIARFIPTNLGGSITVRITRMNEAGEFETFNERGGGVLDAGGSAHYAEILEAFAPVWRYWATGENRPKALERKLSAGARASDIEFKYS